MKRLAARTALAAVLLAAVSASRAGETWDRLWRTDDQRGQVQLDRGDAAAAARSFSDPRRKAYAEAKAGDDAAAARDLANIDDRDAHYNRGNALARSGDLKGALQAYDAALQHDPGDADVRHNRDLVAKALGQPPKPPPQDQQQPKGTRQSDRREQQQDGAQRQGQAQEPGQKPEGAASVPQAASPASAASSAGARPDPRAAQGPPPRPAQAEASASSAEDPGRAAEPGPEKPARPAGAASALPATPRTEQQLAEEQWLRSIPDDPGGLLRRKFMAEHQTRQREGSK